MFVDIMDGFVISSIVWWVYEAVLTSSPLQGTVGKKACGLKVVDYEGQRISFARATGRYFAKFLSSTLFAIGIIMVGWTVRKQGLHDFMAKTLVIRDRK